VVSLLDLLLLLVNSAEVVPGKRVFRVQLDGFRQIFFGIGPLSLLYL